MRGLWWRLESLATTRVVVWTVLTTTLVLALFASVGMGSVALRPGVVIEALADPGHPSHGLLVRVRLPRVVAAMLAGAALATAGALMQTAVRNPLADAGLLGVSAGGGLAAILWLVFFPEQAAFLVAVAFAGSLLAIGSLLTVAAAAGARATPLVLVLSGVALQAILFAGIALVSFLFADRAPAFVAFTVGSFAGVAWREVAAITPAVALGFASAWAGSRLFDLLLFDDATATGLGARVARARLLAACCAALLAAAAVSVAGLVGFVGLLVPNAVRRWTGPRHAQLLPACALAGASLTLVADLLARMLAAPLELPVGALLALVGGPYFLVVLLRRVAR